jgi:hypothetical protein
MNILVINHWLPLDSRENRVIPVYKVMIPARNWAKPIDPGNGVISHLLTI